MFTEFLINTSNHEDLSWCFATGHFHCAQAFRRLDPEAMHHDVAEDIDADALPRRLLYAEHCLRGGPEPPMGSNADVRRHPVHIDCASHRCTLGNGDHSA